jgi:hypothetical protein
VDVVGRDEGEPELVRALDQDLVQDRLLDQIVILELDEERARLERAFHSVEHVEPGALSLLEHALRGDAAHASGQRDEPARLARNGFPGDARRGVARRLDLTERNDADEVLVALFVAGEEHQVIDRDPPSLAPVLDARDVDFASEDRQDAALAAGFVKLERAEHVAVVGHCDGAHAELLRPAGELPDADCAVQERVLAVDVEVNELGHRARLYHSGADWVDSPAWANRI